VKYLQNKGKKRDRNVV